MVNGIPSRRHSHQSACKPALSRLYLGEKRQTHLKMTLRIKEQVLWLDVTVGHTLTVQILDATEDLLEAALNLTRRHVALLDGGIKISTGTELHDFAPVLLLILDEVDGLDDVDVVESGRDAKLGGQFLDVFLFCFVFSSFPELLRKAYS